MSKHPMLCFEGMECTPLIHWALMLGKRTTFCSFIALRSLRGGHGATSQSRAENPPRPPKAGSHGGPGSDGPGEWQGAGARSWSLSFAYLGHFDSWARLT